MDTPTKQPVLLNHMPGTPRRWTKDNWTLQDSTWQCGEVLIVIRPDQQRATCVIWTRDRKFSGWYVNMQSRLTRTPLGFDLRDHQLDILVEPNREWRWKDEEELDICVEQGRIGPDQAKAIRAEAQRAVEEIEKDEGPFAAGLVSWTPEPRLPRPTMSPDWDDLSMYS